MVYKIGELKYTSMYPVVMQSCTKKGKRYVHRAIFYLNKGQVPLDLKDGYLTDLLITLYLCLYFTFIYIFPLFISIFSSSRKPSTEIEERVGSGKKPQTIDRVLVLDEVFVDELDRVLDLVEVFFPEPTRSSISVEGFLGGGAKTRTCSR
jgi:hypothetical protein